MSAEPTRKASPTRAAARARRGASAAARIGVISDTHGYLDPAVLEIFAGVVRIIHAGDIVDPQILADLETVAPVTAVAGNVDTGALADELPREVIDEVAGVTFLVGHKRKRLLKRLSSGRYGDVEPDLVVFGHEHVPSAAWIEGTLFLNPGTASAPDEEDDEPTVAIVSPTANGLAVCFVPLKRRAVDESPTLPKRA